MSVDILDRFNPKIAKYINALFEVDDLCLCGDKPQIRDPKTGLVYPPTSARSWDRFKVLIPFAGQTLQWDVIFSDPEMPPDFIFGSHDLEFVPDIEHIKFLVNWNEDDPEGLVAVLRGLLDQYKRHQMDLANRLSRLQLECEYLKSHNEYDEFEIHLARGSQAYDSTVSILIRIPVDLGSIPPYLINTHENPGKDLAYLLVTYQSPELTCHVSTKLYLSPTLERALGSSSALHIPTWGGQSGACLMDYVPTIHQLLKKKVKQISSGYNLRKDYVVSFFQFFEGSVLEYDAEKFHKMSMLFKVQGFFCILNISLSVGFPLDKPVFTLQSIYHESNGVPYQSTHKEYSYSPRWSPVEMAEAARKFLLLKAVPEFKEASMSNGKF